MTIQTLDLNYNDLIRNRQKTTTGGDSDFITEEWDQIEKFDGRLLIIIKPNTREPIAAVKYNPGKISSGLLYNKIKTGLLLQKPLTQTELNEVASIARALIKYGNASINTDKLNWNLQILDERFNIRVKVEKRMDGYFLTKK